MINKPKAWREASRTNTIEGRLTVRQITAGIRANPTPSALLSNLLRRIA